VRRDNVSIGALARVVRPKENFGVAFRGDAPHQVRKHRSKSGQARVSLVLEQVRLRLRRAAD
jgi:hypothetical protein